VDQMNEALHQGIDWFRSMLRKCRLVIIQELKALGADDQNAKQIAALLSNGPMIPLRSQSIGILHSIMQKHARVFRTASNRPRSADGRPQGSRRG
jgi:hypothetical protein